MIFNNEAWTTTTETMLMRNEQNIQRKKFIFYIPITHDIFIP